MDVETLKALARQTYEAVEPHGPEMAGHVADTLKEQGIVSGMHAGDDPDSFDEVRTLEWALGQFVRLVEHKSWFAMNSMLNKLHDLSV